jgi:hypothetical protein
MDYAILDLPTAGCHVVPVTTVAVLEERVKNHVQFFWTVVAFLVAWLGVGTYLVVDMRSDVKSLLRPQNLVKASSDPNSPKSQAEVQKIIAAAKSGPPIPAASVQRSGANFVKAAEKDPQAWTVATELVSYRTSLNSDLLEVGTAEQIATTPGFREGPTARFFNSPPSYDGPTFTLGGGVTLDQSAQMGLLQQANPEKLASLPHTGLEPQVILGENGAILFDGMVMRHAVLRGTKVFYNGGPTYLEDVIFVDCTFVVENNPTGRLFALAVLGQPQVKFQPTHF